MQTVVLLLLLPQGVRNTHRSPRSGCLHTITTEKLIGTSLYRPCIEGHSILLQSEVSWNRSNDSSLLVKDTQNQGALAVCTGYSVSISGWESEANATQYNCIELGCYNSEWPNTLWFLRRLLTIGLLLAGTLAYFDKPRYASTIA